MFHHVNKWWIAELIIELQSIWRLIGMKYHSRRNLSLWQMAFIGEETDGSNIFSHHNESPLWAPAPGTARVNTVGGVHSQTRLKSGQRKLQLESKFARKTVVDHVRPANGAERGGKKIAVTSCIGAEGNHLPDSFYWLERRYSRM